MGKSDKPDIDYSFKDHIEYVDEFIRKLKLKNVILVVQDWGSAIGFHYACRNPNNVAGIAFFEAITRGIGWKDASFVERIVFGLFRHPRWGKKMIVDWNFFVEKFLQMKAGRKLNKIEMDAYRAPFLDPKSRLPLLMWPREISIEGKPEFSTEVKKKYAEFLPNSQMPKLFFHAKPGMIIKPAEAKEIMLTWRNLEAIDLGKGEHYFQEQHPHKIGEGIADWFKRKF